MTKRSNNLHVNKPDVEFVDTGEDDDQILENVEMAGKSNDTSVRVDSLTNSGTLESNDESRRKIKPLVKSERTTKTSKTTKTAKDPKPTEKKTRRNTKATSTPKVSAARKMEMLDSTFKEYSFKDKMYYSFGFNDKKIKKLIRLRDKWATTLFDVDEERCQDVELPEYKKSSGVRDPQLKIITAKEYAARLPSLPPIDLQFGGQGPFYKLDPGSSEFFEESYENTRRGFAFFTGGVITAMEWIPSYVDVPSKFQYLAVGIINITNPADHRLSLASCDSFASAIQIWRLDLNTYGMTLYQSYLTNFGNVYGFKWSPTILDDPQALGLLGFVSNDGNLRFLKIKKNGEKLNCHFEIEEPSMVYHIDGHAITSFDYIDDTSIIVGTSTGNVGHFIFNDPLPSFLVRVALSYVLSVCAAYDEFTEPTILVTSMDFDVCTFSLSDIHNSKVLGTRLKSISADAKYFPEIFSFILCEGAYALKLIYQRTTSEIPTPLVKHEQGSISSFGFSRLHPQILSGASDGSLIIHNVIRRCMGGRKGQNHIHVPLALWKLEYSDLQNKYRLLSDLQTKQLKASDTVDKPKIYSPKVNISSISWNQNKEAASMYALGTTSGIIIVERLDLKAGKPS